MMHDSKSLKWAVFTGLILFTVLTKMAKRQITIVNNKYFLHSHWCDFFFYIL